MTHFLLTRQLRLLNPCASHNRVIHVISLKRELERCSYHFREVFPKMYRIYKKIINSFQGDFLIL